MPARITIDGAVTVINQPDPEQDQRDAEQKAETRFDNSVDVGTLVFAGLAAAAAYGAYHANRRSANAAEMQIGILRTQLANATTDAAEQRQIAVDALAETRKAAAATTKVADATQASIILTHRPKIVARNIVVPKLEPGRIPATFRGTFWATNTGSSPAQIHRLRAEWLVVDRLPMRNPVVARSAIKSKPRQVGIGAGRSVALILPSRQVDPAEADALLGIGPGRELYLVGLIKYWDANRHLRRTAFCRKWNRQTGRFEVVGDPDYEHAD